MKELPLILDSDQIVWRVKENRISATPRFALERKRNEIAESFAGQIILIRKQSVERPILFKWINALGFAQKREKRAATFRRRDWFSKKAPHVRAIAGS